MHSVHFIGLLWVYDLFKTSTITIEYKAEGRQKMAHKQFNLTVALKDDVITNINDVESGLKCGCVCPACREPLVAKKGKKMMHHFAHHAGHSCEYGYESSLHLAAKEILSRAKRMTLPAVYVSFPDSYKKDEPVCSAKEIELDKVEGPAENFV